MNVSYQAAADAIAAVVASRDPSEAPFSITVLDSGRNIVAFARLDGALLASIESSRGKAYAAVSLDAPSDALFEHIQPGQQFYGFETSQEKPLVLFRGGIPVRVGGKLVGGVGAAGGSLDEDERNAKAVAEQIARLMEADAG